MEEAERVRSSTEPSSWFFINNCKVRDWRSCNFLLATYKPPVSFAEISQGEVQGFRSLQWKCTYWYSNPCTYLYIAWCIFVWQPLVLLAETLIWILQDCESIQFVSYTVPQFLQLWLLWQVFLWNSGKCMHHTMKVYWGSGGVKLHTFLTLELDGSEGSTLCSMSGERKTATAQQ
jgi:hypothetical protein